jgi:hypothetical protein
MKFRIAIVSFSVLAWMLFPAKLLAQVTAPASVSVLYSFDGKCAAATAATHCDPLVLDGGGLKVGDMVQGPPGDDSFYGATPAAFSARSFATNRAAFSRTHPSDSAPESFCSLLSPCRFVCLRYATAPGDATTIETAAR